MANLQRVLIMAGGTGGHVFPGLAIAKCLQEDGVHVDWLGTHKGLEARLVPEAGLPIHFISISGVRGKGWKALLLAPWRLVSAISQAMRVIKQLQPDVIIGMGGFVSGPGGIASRLLRRPLVIHEQNAKPGTTNRWLAHVAKKVLEGFPDTFHANKKVVLTGNPVRKEIENIASPAKRKTTSPEYLHLLVLGGSLGAAAINELVPQALAKISVEKRPLVYHQAGEKHVADAIAAYKNAEVTAEVVPFIQAMDKAYDWADVVLCRAGALTVAELCAAGVGAILVPYPYAIDDHQTANANFMVKQGAGLLVQQTDLTVDKLVEMLEAFITAPERCRAMATAAYGLRKINVADKVLTICKEVCQ